MSFDHSSMEDQLRRLDAAGLSDDFLSRLESCADGSWTQMERTELVIEARLRAVAPAKLPDALMATLEATLAKLPFPVEQPKVVPFPNRETARSRHRHGWAAAAAVALLGAIAGLFVPVDDAGSKLAKATGKPAPVFTADSSRLVPAGFGRNLKEASDQGLVWQSSQRPHRVLKVVYQDRVTLKDASGRTYEVEQPRVEYILVPANPE